MRKLIASIRRRIINMLKDEGDDMQQAKLIDQDDAQAIVGVLMSHAETSDQKAITSMELLARIRRDNTGSDDEADMIEDLEEQIKDFEEDTINLRRIAGIFQGVN